jgi:cell division protein FtsL
MRLARLSSWGVVLMGLAVFASAVAVVHLKHVSRGLFSDLQALERERDALNVEWGQLQIEQSTWALQGRIEALARGRLEMEIPSAESIVLVTP